jgi:2-phospho-L-lactate guanylyltransferase
MVIALIPVKSIALGKSRLAAVLGPDERRALVIAMLRKVVKECAAHGSIHAVCVVTADEEIAVIAEALGAGIIAEGEEAGLSRAVLAGLEAAREAGASRVLILPGDLPLLDQHELERIFEASAGGTQSVIVPCGRGEGTNGLLIPSLSDFAPDYGEASFARHFAHLTELGLQPVALRLPGIAVDIDEPDDLALWLERYDETPARPEEGGAPRAHEDARCPCN